MDYISPKTPKYSIATGRRHTIGIKSDGKVMAVGDNKYGQCNVSGWCDIVAARQLYIAYHLLTVRMFLYNIASDNNDIE